ncbi:MAG: c-type cytochrome, partial [Pirellulaceae bacterium]|nr:c-type cytochrome [Pirellulaceae bacterium]
MLYLPTSSAHCGGASASRKIDLTPFFCLAVGLAHWLDASDPTTSPAAEGPNLHPTVAQVEFFEAKVRPVLSENCFRCHGEDEDQRQAGLRLDGLAHMLQGGDSGPAIVPYEPDKSLVIEAVRYKNEDTSMPPNKKLRDEEIAALTEWVAMGTPWPGFDPTAIATTARKKTDAVNWEFFRQKHWSFRPITKPEPPPVTDSAWPPNAIDSLVLARLAA